MSKTFEWYSGLDNYKKHTLITDPITKKHSYLLEILDKELPTEDRSIFDIFADYLSIRQTKTVEVLFSGGLDSELMLYSCLVKKIPVRALTMRIFIDGILRNTHDLYYSEKFCREHNVEQKFIDLDLKKFYESGSHYRYLEPYLINRSHVASRFWLIEQATGFPITGGEYLWPWAHLDKMVVSPVRSMLNAPDRFMKDNNIMGIGSLIDYGYESNIKFIKTHIKVFKSDLSYFINMNRSKWSYLKYSIWKDIGYKDVEIRRITGGWDFVFIDKEDIEYKERFNKELLEKYGSTTDKIKWNKNLGEILNNEPGENDRFE